MTSILHLPLLCMFSALMLASPAAAARHPRHVATQEPDDTADCLRLGSRDAVLAGVLLTGSLGADSQEFGAVRLSGARSFPDDALWDLIGGPPSIPLTRQKATALLARLAQTGLFSAVEPRSHTLPGQEEAELEIALSEHPQIRSVQVRGLSEFRTEDVLDQLLEVPSNREIERRLEELRGARARECPAPLPPRAWLARVEDGEVHGGVLWQGLRAGLGRVMRFLMTRGYPLARLEGELTAAGEILIEVDEGHVGGVEVRGLEARLAGEVRVELGIQRGDVFSSGELHSALERVQRRWPFVRADRRRRRSSPAPVLRLEERDGGGVKFHSELPLDTKPPSLPGDDGEEDDTDETQSSEHHGWEEEDDFFDVDEPERHHRGNVGDHVREQGAKQGRTQDRKLASRNAWYGFHRDTIVVHLKTELIRGKGQWQELLRHTPVTGFAPGLAMTVTIYDPGDRAHLMLDGAVNINTRRRTFDATGGTFLERLNAQERVDWLFGPRVRLPALGIAELGGQIHTLTDTADRWRISSIDSYFYSALLNRADREYYRRSGFAAFVTAHLFEELTLGAEYRRDRYAPLDVPHGVWSVFNNGDTRYGSAPIDEGEMGSALFRLEYQSEKAPLHRVGSMWRNPETSLVAAERWAIGLRTLNTVEVADRSLGGVFQFTRALSDTSLTLETARNNALTLRLRGAGGHDLPLQKQEGLGGWTALRGYDFKEFRGNASLLATLQVEGRYLGAFLDVGSVHQASTGWLDPKPSVGALLVFAEGSTRAEVAWRLDGHARLAPEFRILFSVPR